MSDNSRRIEAFMTVAEREIASAAILSAAGSIEDAAFFVQQAAEKTARAVLLKENVPFGPVHSLRSHGPRAAHRSHMAEHDQSTRQDL